MSARCSSSRAWKGGSFMCRWNAPQRPSVRSGPHEDRRPSRDRPDEPARLNGRDAHATEARRLADARQLPGGVDGEPVAPRPARRQPVLMAGEREDTAAVGRFGVRDAELVRDGEAADWRGVAPSAYGDLELADDPPVVAHVEHPPREVRMDGPRHAVEPGPVGRQPGELAV